MDGNFVSRSMIPDVSPKETFSCTLGVDPSIRVTYHPTTCVVRKMGSVKSAKSEVTTLSQRISVRNTRSAALLRLIVKDQVPISHDPELQVSLVQPSEKDIGSPNVYTYVSSGLSFSSSSGRAVSVPKSDGRTQAAQINKSVIVRWAQKYEEDGGWGGANGDGILEWICSQVKGTLDLEHVCEVSTPAADCWE